MKLFGALTDALANASLRCPDCGEHWRSQDSSVIELGEGESLECRACHTAFDVAEQLFDSVKDRMPESIGGFQVRVEKLNETPPFDDPVARIS